MSIRGNHVSHGDSVVTSTDNVTDILLPLPVPLLLRYTHGTIFIVQPLDQSPNLTMNRDYIMPKKKSQTDKIQ